MPPYESPGMTGDDFINLLSSDDESGPTHLPSTASRCHSSNATVAQLPRAPLTALSQVGSPYLPDEFDSTVHLDDSYTAPPTKKRKLSRSPKAVAPLPGPSKASVDCAHMQLSQQRTRWTDDEVALLDHDDPIVFSSLAHGDAGPFQTKGKVAEQVDIQSEDSDGSLPEDVFAFVPHRPWQNPNGLPERTAGLLFDSKKQHQSSLMSPKLSEAESRTFTRKLNATGQVSGALGSYSRDKPIALSGNCNKSSMLSDKTKALLAMMDAEGAKRGDDQAFRKLLSVGPKDPPQSITSKHASRARRASGVSEEEVEVSVSSRAIKNRKKIQLTEEQRAQRVAEKERGKEEKVRERERAKEQKAKDKQEGLEQRRREKEEKANQKRKDAEIAEVNKAKLDKKDSTPEMIVDLPASVNGQPIETQTRAFLKELGVEASLYQSAVPNVVKWRRKVEATWNSEIDLWEKLPQMRIENEKHLLCIMPAKEFVALAASQKDSEEDVEMHVAKVKSAYPDCIPIYLIEGLTPLMAKSKNAKNQQYQAKVLSQGAGDEAGTQQQNKRKKSTPLIVDDDVVEDALLRLQVMNGCLVHHTTTMVETAQWIATFTQHISTIPYKLQRMNLETSFCMESGQIKTGEDKADTYFKMLQEVIRVTPPIAQAVMNEYPTVICLLKAFRKNGPLILQDLQKAANRNGAATDRNVGPAISKRLYAIFTELDPTSTKV